MKLSICDDNQKVLSHVKKVIKKVYGNVMEVTEYLNPADLEAACYENEENVPDILIMDICFQMKDKRGIEVSGELQRKYPSLKVIFLTGNIEFVSDIFEIKPSSLVLKPINNDKLIEAVSRVMTELKSSRAIQVSFEKKGHTFLVNPSEVIYIESYQHYIHIHCVNGVEKIRMKMSDCVKRLSGEEYIIIHQSFCVNPRYVVTIKDDNVILSNETRLPVARRKMKMVKEALFRYWNKNS